MAESVNHDTAFKALERAWDDRQSTDRPRPPMKQSIEYVLAASDVTYKYILVTGYLAKHVRPSVHARALKASSKLDGAYDARSLCHGVVVPFEKTKGNLFGLSNEPFVNKPARHPEHDGKNPQLRNKAGAQALHRALEAANSATSAEIRLGLVHILRVADQHASDNKEVISKTQVTQPHVLEFIAEFLQETDGGSRLVAIWATIMALTSEGFKVTVTSPNSSDKFAKTVGDVEIRYGDTLVAAAECKHRPLTLTVVKHGIKKAIDSRVPQYHFVTADGLAESEDGEITNELDAHASEVDLLLVDIWEMNTFIAAILNPVRRAQFGETVVDLLRDMRKFESANRAAELWNKVTGRK